jgi:ubiquinone/menaquinone biosynthesis C-methylase UbiE
VTTSAPAPAPAPAAERSPESDWWDLLPFTVHRIPFGDGLATASSGFDPFVDARTELVLDRCGGSIDRRTLVDLGCLEGGFSLAFAEAGASHVVGIEARAISVERCELARRLRGTERVEFVVADIKDELVQRDPFDIVFAAGILYHIGDPAQMLRTVRASCREFALIDTHVADPDVPSHGCSEMAELHSGNHTYQGRWFPEYDADASASDRDGYLWAAWSDSDAFWPTEDELVRMVLDAGFAAVEKIDMTIGDRQSRWRVDQRNRVVYVATV